MTNLGHAPVLGGALTTKDRWLLSGYDRVYGAAPGHDHIHSAFEEWARRTPLAIAVEQGDEQVTYAELDRRANCLASLLRVHHVVAGDRVGMFLHRSVPMVVGILATLKLGATYVPQDAANTPTEHLGHVISATRSRLVLTLAQHVHRIPSGYGQVVIALDCLALDALKYDGSISYLTSADTPARTAVVIVNPAASGRRNGLAITHESLCNVLLRSPRHSAAPGTRVGLWPGGSVDTAVCDIFRGLCTGGTLVICAEVDEDDRAHGRRRPA